MTMIFDDHDDDDAADIISEGPTSTVTRIDSDSPDGPRLIAVKTSTTTHAKEPHDIIKEARLLASISHPNIVSLIKYQLCQGSQSLSLWMPYIPCSLDGLLRSSRFSPHPIIAFDDATSPVPTPREIRFVTLAKSIIFQVLRGVSYLHSEHVQIAHRDIKPSNVLLTPTGCAQLIDFGIAFPVGEDRAAKAKDLWPESEARMYFEVSTGPYRAPELLFGPRTYDAFAIDAWSLGTTFSEFFTSLCLQTDDDRDEEMDFFPRSDHESESESRADSSVDPPARSPTPPPTPFVIPQGPGTRPGMPTGRWTRSSLFDATRGEIGLAWSIFKIRGTPNGDTWPSFLALPDASKLAFVEVGAMDLGSRLPNLPPSTTASASAAVTHAPSPDPIASPLDLVHRFLVYDPPCRLRPSEALLHPWFKAEPGLVLPADGDHVADANDGDARCLPAWAREGAGVARALMVEGETRTLGELLQMYL